MAHPRRGDSLGNSSPHHSGMDIMPTSDLHLLPSSFRNRQNLPNDGQHLQQGVNRILWRIFHLHLLYLSQVSHQSQNQLLQTRQGQSWRRVNLFFDQKKVANVFPKLLVHRIRNCPKRHWDSFVYRHCDIHDNGVCGLCTILFTDGNLEFYPDDCIRLLDLYGQLQR